MKKLKPILIMALLTALTQDCVVAFATGEAKEDGLYSSFGKRDPFKAPDRGSAAGGVRVQDPAQRFRLESYQLRAVLRLGGVPQAMFEDPEGKSHVVHEGDLIGLEAARVSRIVNSEVIVTERTVNYLGREVLLEKVIALSEGDQVAGKGDAVQQGFSAVNRPGGGAGGLPTLGPEDPAGSRGLANDSGLPQLPADIQGAGGSGMPSGVPTPVRAPAKTPPPPPQTSFRGGK